MPARPADCRPAQSDGRRGRRRSGSSATTRPSAASGRRSPAGADRQARGQRPGRDRGPRERLEGPPAQARRSDESRRAAQAAPADGHAGHGRASARPAAGHAPARRTRPAPREEPKPSRRGTGRDRGHVAGRRCLPARAAIWWSGCASGPATASAPSTCWASSRTSSRRSTASSARAWPRPARPSSTARSWSGSSCPRTRRRVRRRRGRSASRRVSGNA